MNTQFLGVPTQLENNTQLNHKPTGNPSDTAQNCTVHRTDANAEDRTWRLTVSIVSSDRRAGQTGKTRDHFGGALLRLCWEFENEK